MRHSQQQFNKLRRHMSQNSNRPSQQQMPQMQSPRRPEAARESGHALLVPTEEDIQAFIIAIRSGSLQRMKEMLCEFRGNISNKLESQLRQPPLYFAAINADEEMSFEMIKSLIESGANPNFRDANEQTIMFYICRDGKKKIAEYLMKHGCRLDEEDLYGQTPIYYAASENRVEMLDLFSSEMINHIDKLAKQTPLYYAARKGHIEMCRELIERGCNVNHHDSNNKTALEYAKKARFQEVVDLLSMEIKKTKEISKVQNQSVQESSQNETNRRKKKDNVTLNMNKNTYKITLMNENGELHDLTEEEVKELCRSNPDIETYLSNPDSIPQDLLESTLQESWEKIAVKVLNQCWKVKSAYWFYEPVDPVKYGIMDYFDIVSNPMDLGTIKKRLNYNVYSSAQQFVNEMRLVWRNCLKYNGDTHEISQCAKEVSKAFDEATRTHGLTKYYDD